MSLPPTAQVLENTTNNSLDLDSLDTSSVLAQNKSLQQSEWKGHVRVKVTRAAATIEGPSFATEAAAAKAESEVFGAKANPDQATMTLVETGSDVTENSDPIHADSLMNLHDDDFLPDSPLMMDNTQCINPCAAPHNGFRLPKSRQAHYGEVRNELSSTHTATSDYDFVHHHQQQQQQHSQHFAPSYETTNHLQYEDQNQSLAPNQEDNSIHHISMAYQMPVYEHQYHQESNHFHSPTSDTSMYHQVSNVLAPDAMDFFSNFDHNDHEDLMVPPPPPPPFNFDITDASPADDCSQPASPLNAMEDPCGSPSSAKKKTKKKQASPSQRKSRRSSSKSKSRVRSRRGSPPQRELTSRFRGVCWYKRTKRWVVQLKINGVRRHVGYFKDENAAAVAYEEAIREIRGDTTN